MGEGPAGPGFVMWTTCHSQCLPQKVASHQGLSSGSAGARRPGLVRGRWPMLVKAGGTRSRRLGAQGLARSLACTRAAGARHIGGRCIRLGRSRSGRGWRFCLVRGSAATAWGGSGLSICEGGTPSPYPRRGAEAEGTAPHGDWSHPGALGLRAMYLATGSLGVSSSNWHSGHLCPTLGPPSGMRMSSEPEHQQDQASTAHLVPAGR